MNGEALGQFINQVFMPSSVFIAGAVIGTTVALISFLFIRHVLEDDSNA